MHAAVQVSYGAAETSVRLQEMPRPTPGADEVLLRVVGSTLNRKDLFALTNLSGPGIRPRPPLPHVNGTDAWGIVAAVGSTVCGWQPGDRAVVYPGLYCSGCEWCQRGETSACVSYGVLGEQVWGSHAAHLVVAARNLEPIPDGMTPDALACAGGSWLTAWRALVGVARIRPGESVLVTGASGGVGTAAVRIARVAGCRVLAVVGSPWKGERAREIGADDVIINGDSTTAAVRALTKGRGVDVALDCVGGDTWRRTIQSLARLGRMAICGATAGDMPAISIREIYQEHRSILGAALGTRAEFHDLVLSLASGRLEPVVYARLPLDRIHDGLRALETRDFFGKIALDVDAVDRT
jgi:NADPH:quinone reductase-like Zn-dependent oxidoreductase